jgi:hypothetical protein
MTAGIFAFYPIGVVIMPVGFGGISGQISSKNTSPDQSGKDRSICRLPVDGLNPGP